METFKRHTLIRFGNLPFLIYMCFPICAEVEHCRNNNETALSAIKCVWTIQGGNLSESERACEQNGGTIFTFGTIDEAVNILDTLGIKKDDPVFVGAVENNWNQTSYYDWLSRPSTWSVDVQLEITNDRNISADGGCLVLVNGTLCRESCGAHMNTSVCEKEATSDCNCKDNTTIPTSPALVTFPVLRASSNPLTSLRKTLNKTADNLIPMDPTQSWDELFNETYLEISDHVLSFDNDSETKDYMLENIFSHVFSHTNGTLENLNMSSNSKGPSLSAPGLGSMHVHSDNTSVNYSNVVNVLNITFGALIDNIIVNVIDQGCKTNNSGTACQSTTEVADTTVGPEKDKSATTIPVTEVKFHFVSGLQNGPTMTGSDNHPPLRIDLHSKNYSIFVNISRELMEYQSIKHVDNNTLLSFAESVSNWTVDQRLVTDTKDVQTDLFEDILQVAEDLVGNISTSNNDIKVSSRSIDIVSKIVKPSDSGTHTDFNLGTDVVNIGLQVSNVIFVNDSVKVRVSTVCYRKMDSIAKVVDKRISSPVVSVTVKYIIGDRIERQKIETEDAIIFTMRTFLHKEKQEQNRLCTYWSFKKSRWSTTGCKVVAKNSSFTTCKCNHLTNFAVLVMYLDNDQISLENQHVLFTLTTVGCSLSIACLAMTLITYVYLRMLSNEKIMIHANLSLALMLAQIVFVSSRDAHYHKTACKVVALSLHFLFMASFAWMMVEGIALYITCTRGLLANVNRGMKAKYFLIGWGVPAIIVVISCAAHFPSYGDGPQYSCWLSTQNGLIWAFLGPMLVIVLLNMGVMGLVVKVFLTLRANTEKTELARLRGSLRAMMTLLPLLGLGWILSLLVPFSVVFNYFFVIVNTLQGMCIFFLHCICNEEIRKLFRERRRRWSTTRTASDFDVTCHTRRKAGSFDGIKAATISVPMDNGRRHVWKENDNTQGI